MVREDPTQSMGSNCSLFDENAVLQTWYRNIWYLQTVSSPKKLGSFVQCQRCKTCACPIWAFYAYKPVVCPTDVKEKFCVTVG